MVLVFRNIGAAAPFTGRSGRRDINSKWSPLTDGFVMQRRIWSGPPRYDVGLYRPGKQPGVLIFILSGVEYMDMHQPEKSSSSFNALAASKGVGE